MRSKNESERVTLTSFPDIEESKNFKSTQEVLDYVIEHPFRASLNSLVPKFIHHGIYGSLKADVFALAVHLKLMGLDAQVLKLQEILNNSEKGRGEKLQDSLDHLYRLFDVLSGDESLAKHEASFKRLKKLTHKIARDNDFDRRLFNLEKLKLKLEGQRDHAEKEKGKWNNKALLSFARLFKLKKLQNKIENKFEDIDHEEKEKIRKQLLYIGRLRSEYPERKYAYIKDLEFDPVSTDEERRSRRIAKRFLRVASTTMSVLVGISEGFVAAVFAAVLWPVTLTLIIIGVPGFISNFYLFNHDSYEIFKDIYSGRLFKKPNGQPFSGKEKILASILLFACVAGAALFGFLSFSSGIAGYAALFAIIGLSANPFGILVLAGIVAVVTAIALFTVFAYLSVNWVRNDGPKKLKNNILNLKTNFINFWKHENWSKLTLGQRAKHIAGKVGIALCNTLFFALAVTLVVLVNVVTLGQLKHHSVIVFNGVFGLAKPASNLLAFVFVGVGGVMSSVFYGNGMMRVVNIGKDIVQSIGRAILHPVRTYHHIKANWDSIKTSPIRMVVACATLLKRAFLSSCAVMNAVGQGLGGMGPVAESWVHGITRLSPDVVRNVNMDVVGNVNMVVSGGGSGGTNISGVVNATQSTDVLESDAIERINKKTGVTTPAKVNKEAVTAPRITSPVVKPKPSKNPFALFGAKSNKQGKTAESDISAKATPSPNPS